MKFLNFNKVLCLSPHPDDVEYGMLGSMCKYKDTKFDILTMSVGGNFDDTTDVTRFDESLKVVEHIDNVDSQLLDTIDYLKNISEDEMISKIESKYDISEYDAIFIPPEEDTHQDHKKVSVIGKALTRKHKCGIIDYKTPHTLDHWIPNFFVDLHHHEPRNSEDGHSEGTHLLFLAATWYIKLNRMKKFESQKKQPYFSDDSIKSFHSNYQCTRRGMNNVEQFKIIRGYN
tara:strand:+ start:55 stop:744 length:690 start_codon:yes stop_codon:yes gene_type:complete